MSPSGVYLQLKVQIDDVFPAIHGGGDSECRRRRMAEITHRRQRTHGSTLPGELSQIISILTRHEAYEGPSLPANDESPVDSKRTPYNIRAEIRKQKIRVVAVCFVMLWTHGHSNTRAHSRLQLQSPYKGDGNKYYPVTCDSEKEGVNWIFMIDALDNALLTFKGTGMETRIHKRINGIRRAEGGDTGGLSSDSDPDAVPNLSGPSAHRSNERTSTIDGHEADDDINIRSGKNERQTIVDPHVGELELKEPNERKGDHEKATRMSSEAKATSVMRLPVDLRNLPTSDAQPSALPLGSPRPQDGLRRRTTAQTLQTASEMSYTLSQPLTLSQVLEHMSPVRLAFFDKLNAELSKVECFFNEREAEARVRSSQLRGQLDELKDHRRLFHNAHPDVQPPVSLYLRPFPTSNAPKRISRVLHFSSEPTHTDAKAPVQGHDGDPTSQSHERRLADGAKLDPDEYLHARKQLKRAVSEHYHALEVLNNYRRRQILNITGFRKAVKKFEKILVQDSFMKEKVDMCAFASDETVQRLLKEMEDQFTARFGGNFVMTYFVNVPHKLCIAKGDRKRALVRLRNISSHKTHHFSTFRTGIALGLAFPAVIDGITQALQPHTRAAIPSWGSLLYIYAVLLVPTLLAFLVGTNLLIWNASRINYVFIFGTHLGTSLPCQHLDIRTRLDHREYFEVDNFIPSIALATLCWAFWLSFTRSGEPTIQPWTWPIVWLLLVLVLMTNPLPVMSRESRWWFLRKVARLLFSGLYRVETSGWGAYSPSQRWAAGWPLTSCAMSGTNSALWHSRSATSTLSRVHTLEDSGPMTIQSMTAAIPPFGGGKYLIGIVYYFSYYIWRHNGLRQFYYLAIITNVLLRFIWIIYIPTRGPSAALRTWIAALFEVLRRCQWNVYRLENEHLGNMDQYRITREVPLPYSFDELHHETDAGDEDDDAPKRERVRSSKSKEG
ncbi:SPX domain-containing protein [Russula earlei]|uniref:SPX domain-containing protein n=1 Tax=Russula earlei TaxID=71964 RepID=A0ACC0U8M0_9AGAM|nr:SPX domain-containing protein [Russula earlei]